MLIAIPSKGRAGSTATDKIIPSGVMFVPESEIHQYQKFNHRVIGVPITVRGITATRNWILNNTDEQRVVFLDDDVKTHGFIRFYKHNVTSVAIKDESFWLNEFEMYFDLCEQMQFKIWGVKTEAATRSTYPFKPILFQTYVTASCMGIINDGEYRFDESFPVKEDYEICLRHVRDKGGILGIRYVHWENDHWRREGGCKDYRTIAMERDCIKRLIREYPSMIRQAERRANEFTIRLWF